MKHIFTFFFCVIFTFSFSQKKLPIVKSNYENVIIVESGEVITEWLLNPKLKPDVYITGKISKSKKVKFIADIDSIEVTLKPNQKFDFIVLLNKKDSCYTTFESPTFQN